MSKDMKFENLDRRLKYIDIFMQLDAEKDIPQYELPEGYTFATYDYGDRDDWISIEWSAKEFRSYAEGIDAWNRYYAKYEHQLPGRMFFVVAPNGEKIATASAFFDPKNPNDGKGWLHWVAIRRDHQGKGIARPLIAKALSRLRELGYGTLYVHTQTISWVAARLYMEFGFRPTAENAVESEFGYRMLRTLTNHPALADFEPVPVEDMLAEEEA